MKKFSIYSIFLCLLSLGYSSRLSGQASSLPYSQNFESNNDLTLVNGSQVNPWVYGSAAGNMGKSVYISNDDGVSNAYTLTTTSTTHVYKDLVIPAGATLAELTFDWRAEGQTTLDYMQVWLAPTTFTPTAGSLVTTGSGKIKIDSYFNQQGSWITYSKPNVDVSSFAGSTVRLIFTWRNNATLGTQTPAALDNIKFSIPNCLVPSNFEHNNVGANTAYISWDAPNPAPANGYEYYISSTNTAPTSTTNGTLVNSNSTTIAGLTPSTDYTWWVRSVCSTNEKSPWIEGTSFKTTQIPANLPYRQDFSNGNDFYFANGTQINKWVLGTAAGNPGSSIYISSDNGNSNYYNITAPQTYAHAYRDINIPSGSSIAAFSFDWRNVGQITSDVLKVWLVPTTYEPTAGTAITAGTGRKQVGTTFYNQSTWQNYSLPDLDISSFAGGTMRLVFEWRNNATTGTQTPAAIDNVILEIPSCLVPSDPINTNIGATTAVLDWTAPNPVPAIGYEYYFSLNNTAPTNATVGTMVSNTTASVTGLTPLTTYYWWVRSVCTNSDKSDWIPGTSFITTQIPATLPYRQDFSIGNDFILNNGTQVNKWVYGSATGNTGNSLYISNDNGVSNTYTITTTSTTQAYRDILIPAGSTTANFSFDWKAMGQTTLDYCKVFLVPSTYTPVVGSTTTTTAGSGRILVGSYFNLKNTWQTYDTPNLDISSFAGKTMRLVFEWRNNASTGVQTPIAIDNIVLEIPSCLVPSGTTTGVIGATTAELNWDNPTPAPATGYEYYISTTNVAPANSTTGTIVPNNNATATGLTPSTTYYWWVRSVCTGSNVSDWIAGPSFITTQIPATLPYNQNFSNGNDFYLSNGTQVNQWVYGSAAGNTGNAIYVSNDNGVSNTYTITTLSTTHAYRDFIIPAGANLATLSYDWRAVGQSNTDYMKVWMVPTTYNPTPGTLITSGSGRIQIGTYNQLQSNWTSYLNTAVNLSTFAGSTMRLVFEWRNNATTGTQTPAAVDNINLFIPSCFVPTALATSNIATTSATLGWTAPNPTPSTGYEYYISTTNIAPTATTVGTLVTTNSATPNNLVNNTNYFWWVRSVCGTSDKSLWVEGPSFYTLQIPANLPYIEDFSTGHGLTLENGNQVNRWVRGTAVGNTGASLYISNDNGATHNYDINTLSSVHAYRDVVIPAGATLASLSFDWRADGQTTLDYLRVWLVPTTFKPTAGTLISTGSGKIQIGNYFNQINTWQSYTNTNVNVSSFAGTRVRLVFEWRNNATLGTQNPAAVDNIKFVICNNDTPTVSLTNVGHDSALISWNQDIGGASYSIRYRPTGTANWITVPVPAAVYPATTNSYTLTSLIPATNYEVEVAAICNSTTGVFSHDVFNTKCDPTPPNITFSNITTTSALITFNPLAASATYVLRWKEAGTTTWNTVNNIVPPTNTYQLNGLSSYKTYEVQVANICNGETTINQWSNLQIFTTVRECQIAPPGLTIVELKPTTAELTWEAFAGASYIIKYRKVGLPGWTTIPVNNNSYILTGLLELTKYEVQVSNVCNGSAGNFTELYYFTTPTVVYCEMRSDDGSSEFISKVTAKPNGKPEMTNESLGSNYTDYTGNASKLIELVQGTSNNEIIIEKNLVAGSKAGVAVWIDFNRNGTFDIDEKILSEWPTDNAIAKATFHVPVDASISTAEYKYVVMRVALQKDGMPVVCENFANGEVEDYIVRISKQLVPNTLNQNEVIIYPNPVKTILNVKNVSKKANYKIYNLAGQIVGSGILLNNQVNVNNLINGVYVIDIIDNGTTVQKKFIKE